MVTKQIQQEVEAYIANTYNTKPYEWLSHNRFVDYHGCDGYIFKNERAARRYILSDIHEKGWDCKHACDDATWINILVNIGMTLRWAKKYVQQGLWEKVDRRMLNACGPSHFLSTYSGCVSVLSDGSLLYY